LPFFYLTALPPHFYAHRLTLQSYPGRRVARISLNQDHSAAKAPGRTRAPATSMQVHSTRRPVTFVSLIVGCTVLLGFSPHTIWGIQPIQVGLVTEISGHWQIQTPRGRKVRLTGGESLPDGSVLSTHDLQAAICIARFDQAKSEWYRVPGNYAGPVTLRTERQQVTVSARFQRALQRFFATPRTIYVPTLSRQQETISLHDEVVPLTADGIDLSAVFADAGSGRDIAILLRKVRVGHGSERRLAWSTLATTPVQWQPGAQAMLHTPHLPMGLYRLVLKSAPSGADAFLLVLAPPLFAERSSEFATVRQLEPWWGDGLDARARRGRLRSYLDVMSDDLPKH
jgi:hypothetical protein